jgi:hypothetical protein
MSQKPKFNYLVRIHLVGVQEITLLLLWSVYICVHAQGTNLAKVISGPGFQIVTESVEQQGTFDGQPLYRLSYHFDFYNRDKIFLKDFGNIEARGELSYLAPSKVVEFWSSDQREKLTTVEFKETAAPKGDKGDELLPPGKFRPMKRESPWPASLPAQLNILKLINKYYPTGARPWIEEGFNYFETAFKPLGSLPRGTLGQVALLISFPATPNSDPYYINVQAAVQERLRLEDWRADDISAETSNSAENFVALFAADLQKASGIQ